MYAIISELDAVSADSVRLLWLKLRNKCGLKKIYDLPTPHLTWVVAEEINISSSASIIDELVANNCGFTTHSFGVGIFTGVRPVLYLPLVKTQAMIDIHNQVWNQVPTFTNQPNRYYSPLYWMPHITLAVNDLSSQSLACALDSLAFEELDMSVSIDNMIIVAQGADPKNEALHRFRFCG